MIHRQEIKSTGSTNLIAVENSELSMVIEAPSQVSSEAEGFYSVIVRIRADFPKGQVGLDSLSEISMALTLSQAERLRNCLALFFEERTNEFPVRFHLEGDNTRRQIAPKAYVHRREHAARTEKVRRVTTNNSSLRQATLQHPRGSCPKAFQSTN